MKIVVLAAALVGSAVTEALASEGYRRPDRLIEPADLAKALDSGQFAIVDVRSREQYEKERLPGARHIDADAWAKAFDDGRDAPAWSGRLGALGLERGAKAVVYDDKGMKDAGRIWWILRYWGVDDVRLLNGGWKGWKAAGLPTSTETPAPAQGEFEVEPRRALLAGREDVLAVIEKRSSQIVDARSKQEHCGLDKLRNQRGGAMPGAKHLDWTDLIDQATHRFKPADELERLFRNAGIDPRRPAVVHCQSGGRSSVMAFALELMGASEVRNYYRSWGEWGNRDDTPIVVPKP